MNDSNRATLTDRQFVRILIPAVVIVGFIAYGNTFDGEFVWDDASSILLHEHVQDPGSFFRLFTEDQHAFAGGQGNFYRPLVSASFMLDHVLTRWSADGAGGTAGTFFYHLSSTLWHVAAAVLLLLLMAALGAPRPVLMAVPLIYAVHPLHTEAVAYISGRADSMSAAFMFAGLLCCARADIAGKRAVRWLLALGCFAAALMSKESSLIFPVLLFLVLMHGQLNAGGKSETATAALRFAPFLGSLVLLGVYAYLRSTYLSFGSDQAPPDSTFGMRLQEAMQAFALYFGLIAAPRGLHMERTLADATLATALIGCVLVILCAGVVAYGVFARRHRVALGMSWFLLCWLPISGLFPLNAPMAEHWMYVPLAGLLWALAELVWRDDRPGAAGKVALAVAAVWCVLLLGATVARNRDWHDNETLYSATLRENPESRRVQFNLAVTYGDLLGNPWGARRHYEEVVASFEREKSASPEQAGLFWTEELDAHLSLANIFFERQRYAEAVEHLQIVLQVAPGEATRSIVGQAAYTMGRILLNSGNRPLAGEQFQRAIELEPRLEPRISALLGV